MAIFQERGMEKARTYLRRIYDMRIRVSFLHEFVKNDQEPFEAGMMLNMGQWLSIPFVLAGCWFVWRALRNGKLKIEN